MLQKLSFLLYYNSYIGIKLARGIVDMVLSGNRPFFFVDGFSETRTKICGFTCFLEKELETCGGFIETERRPEGPAGCKASHSTRKLPVSMNTTTGFQAPTPKTREYRKFYVRVSLNTVHKK